MAHQDNLLKALRYYQDNRQAFIERLKALTQLPSISFKGFPQEPMEQTAQAVATLFSEIGMKHTEILRVSGAPPYVYSEWLGNKNAPTVLLYAHYDVQPPLREELWRSPPFQPTERDGRIYARGIADDKAGVVTHAASLAAWLSASDGIPVNVRVLIDGEEETGSAHLVQLLQAHKTRFASDCLILCDGANYDTGFPGLTTSLRGLVCLEVTVAALDHPLHSGMWGGPLPDPVMALSKMIAGLTDENGRLAVPGILNSAEGLSEKEISDIQRLPMTTLEFRRQSGILPGARVFGEDADILRQTWKVPSLVINAMAAGDRNTGNVIMDRAWAKIGLRTVPGMDPEKTAGLLQSWLEKTCPWGLKLEIVRETSAGAWRSSINHPAFDAAVSALAKGFGREPVFIGSGGTIPFVLTLTEVLGNIPVLLTGIEDPPTNAHSENESLCIDDFHKGILSQIHFFEEFGREMVRSLKPISGVRSQYSE